MLWLASLCTRTTFADSPESANANSAATRRADSGAGHWILLGAKGRLVLTDPGGEIRWEMPWNNIHDLHLTAGGDILTRRGKHEVVRIRPRDKRVVWTVNVQKLVDTPVELHAFEPLPDGGTMVALSGAAVILELDQEGKVRHRIPLRVKQPSVHSDTRLVRRDPDDGGYWVAHENDGCVRRYDRDGKVIWQFDVPLFGGKPAGGHGHEAYGNRLFAAIPKPDGGVWIGTGNGHSVLEVSADKKIIWKLAQNDLEGIRFAWVTNVHPTSSGTILIGNCHAGPGQPVLVEVDLKTKRVVWQLDGYRRFGNSVSNTLRLTADQAAAFQK